MNIDWSKAPDWAEAYALWPFLGEIAEVWVGDDQFQRLDNPQIFPYGGGSGDTCHNPRRSSFRFEVARPGPWAGEGLPPVGTVCEFAGFNPEETTFDDPSVGGAVTVIAHYLSGCVQVAAFTYNCSANFGALNVAQGAYGCFRPIRTAEQIAAEEREKEVNRMVATASMLDKGWARKVCADLYDAGYRKQEATQ